MVQNAKLISQEHYKTSHLHVLYWFAVLLISFITFQCYMKIQVNIVCICLPFNFSHRS